MAFLRRQRTRVRDERLTLQGDDLMGWDSSSDEEEKNAKHTESRVWEKLQLEDMKRRVKGEKKWSVGKKVPPLTRTGRNYHPPEKTRSTVYHYGNPYSSDDLTVKQCTPRGRQEDFLQRLTPRKDLVIINHLETLPDAKQVVEEICCRGAIDRLFMHNLIMDIGQTDEMYPRQETPRVLKEAMPFFNVVYGNVFEKKTRKDCDAIAYLTSCDFDCLIGNGLHLQREIYNKPSVSQSMPAPLHHNYVGNVMRQTLDCKPYVIYHVLVKKRSSDPIEKPVLMEALNKLRVWTQKEGIRNLFVPELSLHDIKLSHTYFCNALKDYVCGPSCNVTVFLRNISPCMISSASPRNANSV